MPLPLIHNSMQAVLTCTATMNSVFGCAFVLRLCGPCSACSREDNGAEGEGRLPNDTGATSANPGKGFLDRASTWAPGTMPGAMTGGIWSPDVLAGLYGGWNVALQPGAQPAELAAQQGTAAAVSQRGMPRAAEGDWRSVVQAAAAAASQLEISKLSGRESTRSMELGDEAPLASPPASLCKAHRAPATIARLHHKVTICEELQLHHSPPWEIVLLCVSATVFEARCLELSGEIAWSLRLRSEACPAAARQRVQGAAQQPQRQRWQRHQWRQEPL